jgi:hypothetical protein
VAWQRSASADVPRRQPEPISPTAATITKASVPGSAIDIMGLIPSPTLVARYWHDFRGDEHGIEFLDGRSEEWPVGRMVDFVTGGGPEPLGLSDAAVAYLIQKLSSTFSGTEKPAGAPGSRSTVGMPETMPFD